MRGCSACRRKAIDDAIARTIVHAVNGVQTSKLEYHPTAVARRGGIRYGRRLIVQEDGWSDDPDKISILHRGIEPLAKRSTPIVSAYEICRSRWTCRGPVQRLRIAVIDLK